MDQDTNSAEVIDTTPAALTGARPDSSTLLEKVQGLIRDKTRFEPEDVKALSEVESRQDFTLTVTYALHAKVEEIEINGFFVRNVNDLESTDYGSPKLKAGFESRDRLLLATQQLDTKLKSDGFPYNKIQEGAYLGHKTKHWRLNTCSGCSGKGRQTCHTCNGAREETCYRCFGGMNITCDAFGCLGGSTTCSHCGGSGQISRQVATTVYGPNGSSTAYHTEYQHCTNYGCRGGRITCMKCSGTARIQCPVCFARGRIQCRTCSGMGDLLCKPCDGSGKVGQAAWVDVHVRPDYEVVLPDASTENGRRIADKEGPHGIALVASQMNFHSAFGGDPQLSSYWCAMYRGNFKLVQLSAECNQTEYEVVAYGQDLRWLTLDNIVEDLLRSDLRKLSEALAHASDEGLFARDLNGLLDPLRAVAASELNAEVVESVLNEDAKPSHAEVVSPDYVTGIRTGILGSLRHIYTRLAKNFWWKAGLASALVFLLVWLFSSASLALLMGLLTLPVSYFLFRRLVLKTLTTALGSPEKAQRAAAIASKGKRDQLALVIVLAPSAMLALALGYLLPHHGPWGGAASHASSQPQKENLAPTQVNATLQGSGVAQAVALFMKGDYIPARSQIEKLAQSGDPGAAGLYGYMVVLGRGLNPSEQLKTDQDWEKQYALAKPWIEKGLAVNDAWALGAKGVMLTQGWGGSRDTAQGLEFLRQAASLGNVPAMHTLGLININGDHVPVNAAEARKWFRLAAEQNSAADIYNLGLMDWNGTAISQPNRESAMALWKKAAQLGEERAIKAVANGRP